MNNELILNITPNSLSIALLDDKQLVELHEEKSSQKFTVGDIYIAKVKKIMPGLNAAFVDVGYKKDAFLHYLDLGAQFNSQQQFLKQILNGNNDIVKVDSQVLGDSIDKNGKISDVLTSGQLILVQIAKEPISTKGPRLSAELSLAGRNLVLIPFLNKISISQKIKSKEERDRLKTLLQSIKPNNFGIIARTISKNRRVAVLDEELRELIIKWEKAFELKDIKVPHLILGEVNKPVALIRDAMDNSFSNIYINNEKAYNQVKEYVTQIAPDKQKIVKLYKNHTDIFEHFGIIKQIKSLFGKTVNIKSGAYLIIEHTEALHVIDVNSGNRSKKAKDQATNALEVNMLAAEEIARQLRLRDMGGIIVVDFIDMYNNENKRLVYDKMKEEMGKDRTKHTILPLSKFGLMQITRQRVRPATAIKTKEVCPTCDGTGEITPSILFIDEIENHLRYILDHNKGKITLNVHPYIAGYLKQGFLSRRLQWLKKYKRYVKIRSSIIYNFLEYNFTNEKGEEIKN